jgi:glycosyltransferase involved in cell wall biosynthesis
MNIAVIISTLNRPAVLHDTVLSIQRQCTRPRQILVSSPSLGHVLRQTLSLSQVQFVQSPIGSCAQRNAALGAVSPDTDLIAFLDDDIELCNSYFEEMVRLFKSRPEIIVSSGFMLHDGGRGSRITRERARELCDKQDGAATTGDLGVEPLDYGYGCNFVCRYSRARNFRFDERLPLYGWLEDSDFSHRCTQGLHGPVTNLRAQAIHLGWRSGRTSGLRLGFSTIVNPMYLRQKAKIFSLRHVIVNLWGRCLIGNIIGLLTNDREYDRAGLLKGNLAGFRHLLSGRCEPEEVLRLR